jgi:hypothetical protein
MLFLQFSTDQPSNKSSKKDALKRLLLEALGFSKGSLSSSN